MSRPSLQEIRQRIGSGIAVFVEGASEKDDPFYYRRWFDDQARTFTFFAGGGWQEVMRIVQELRQQDPALPVYGIIDRDYADDEEWEAFNEQFEQTHVLKTPKFMLENYLLNPDGWAKVFEFLFRRYGGAPEGWRSPEEIALKIEDAYRACLSLAAHNWVIKFGNERYTEQAATTPENLRCYLQHPDALQGVNPEEKLAQWGKMLSAKENFAELYQQRLTWLQQQSLLDWEKFVPGKFVLAVLHRQFPRRPGARGFDLSHYLDLYMDKCPEPPDDLNEILQRIRRAAGR